MGFNYLYGKQANQFSYICIPKILIMEDEFSEISLEAKMLYGLLIERMGMYDKNQWKDENGRVYVVYPIKEIMYDMNRSENSVKKYLVELENAGLMERRERQKGLPDMIYPKKISYSVNSQVV